MYIGSIYTNDCIFLEDLPEQQRLQLCTIPPRNRLGTTVRGDLRGYRRKVTVWQMSVSCPIVHTAGRSVLWIRK